MEPFRRIVAPIHSGQGIRNQKIVVDMATGACDNAWEQNLTGGPPSPRGAVGPTPQPRSLRTRQPRIRPRPRSQEETHNTLGRRCGVVDPLDPLKLWLLVTAMGKMKTIVVGQTSRRKYYFVEVATK